jgi:hypothetical protein
MRAKIKDRKTEIELLGDAVLSVVLFYFQRIDNSCFVNAFFVV